MVRLWAADFVFAERELQGPKKSRTVRWIHSSVNFSGLVITTLTNNPLLLSNNRAGLGGRRLLPCYLRDSESASRISTQYCVEATEKRVGFREEGLPAGKGSPL